MGLRFLHPVIFIDDVELTKHSCNTIDSIHSTTLMLKSMKLKPALRDSLSAQQESAHIEQSSTAIIATYKGEAVASPAVDRLVAKFGPEAKPIARALPANPNPPPNIP